MVQRTPWHKYLMSVVVLQPQAEYGYAGQELPGLKMTWCLSRSCAEAARVKMKRCERQSRARGHSDEAEELQAANQGRSQSRHG
ncbi:hypothetical protein NDU88_008006 [Pleurodeles waltl]|uniref:Uncharacterized protein n=1 Tax=Pleurodeles waltl TaxID=8319 RepID=A0AAV7VW02_PLEWA|nr:hypothetical protein NDU88_008006 [Pleurodeles waltl]